MADRGDWGGIGFLRGTGGLRMFEVAKVLRILENLIISSLLNCKL
jgi:hypothetical protein